MLREGHRPPTRANNRAKQTSKARRNASMDAPRRPRTETSNAPAQLQRGGLQEYIREYIREGLQRIHKRMQIGGREKRSGRKRCHGDTADYRARFTSTPAESPSGEMNQIISSTKCAIEHVHCEPSALERIYNRRKSWDAMHWCTRALTCPIPCSDVPPSPTIPSLNTQ